MYFAHIFLLNSSFTSINLLQSPFYMCRVTLLLFFCKRRVVACWRISETAYLNAYANSFFFPCCMRLEVSFITNLTRKRGRTGSDSILISCVPAYDCTDKQVFHCWAESVICIMSYFIVIQCRALEQMDSSVFLQTRFQTLMSKSARVLNLLMNTMMRSKLLCFYKCILYLFTDYFVITQ